MKACSPILGLLWDSDPNKSKWSLITKAWSIIRDQVGKERASLDEFFSYACPYLNIPSPEQYLDMVGWVPVGDQKESLAIIRKPEYSAEPAEAAVTNEAHSVEDIIRHCQILGYAEDFVLRPNLTTTTFLGHSNATKSRAVPMKHTAKSTSAIEKRAAVRKQRQDKREVAQEKGISQFFRGLSQDSQSSGQVEAANNHSWSSHSTQIPDGPVFNTNNTGLGNDTRRNPLSAADQNISADETLYTALQGFMTSTQPELLATQPQSQGEPTRSYCTGFEFNTIGGSSCDEMPFNPAVGEQAPLGVGQQAPLSYGEQSLLTYEEQAALSYGEQAPSYREQAPLFGQQAPLFEQQQSADSSAFRMGADTYTTLPPYTDFTSDHTN